MAQRGGARPGAGRKKGSKSTKLTMISGDFDRLKIDIKSPDETPLEPKDFWLALMRDNELPLSVRKYAAEQAAPYIHAKFGQKLPNTVQGELFNEGGGEPGNVINWTRFLEQKK